MPGLLTRRHGAAARGRGGYNPPEKVRALRNQSLPEYPYFCAFSYLNKALIERLLFALLNLGTKTMLLEAQKMLIYTSK